MEKQGEKFLEWLLGNLQNLEQFAIDQAPAFIQEFLTFWAYFHWAWVITLGLMTLSGIVATINLYRRDEEVWPVMMWLTSFSLVPFCWQVFMLIKIYIAPKVYIFDSFEYLIS